MPAAVDSRVAKDDGVEAVAARIIEHVLVSGALRAAVGRLEIQSHRFVQAIGVVRGDIARHRLAQAHAGKFAVHFVARRIDHGSLGTTTADVFQQIDRAEHVALEIPARILHRSGHRDLAGEVENRVGFVLLEQLGQVILVARVAVDEIHIAQRAQPSQVCGCAESREVVEHDHRIAAL